MHEATLQSIAMSLHAYCRLVQLVQRLHQIVSRAKIMKQFFSFVALMVVAHFCNTAAAFPVRISHPLTQTIAQSSEIIVVRLVNYTVDPMDYVPSGVKTPSGQTAYFGVDAFLIVNRIKSRGEYTFEVLQNLKGQSEKSLQLKLPPVLSHYYGDARLKIEPGDEFLLLLKRDAQNHLVPTDDTLPLIPLATNSPTASNQVVAQTESAAAVQFRVLSSMLSGLTNPTIRQANVYLVHKTIDPQVVTGVAPYLDDTNVDIQDFVLYGLATNQQVSVIPRIVALDKKMGDDESPTSRSARSLVALQHFNTPAALLYLNPLLFDTSRIIRINTILGIQNYSDRSSIPYLLLSLRDPDSHKFIVPLAAQLLSRLIPQIERGKMDDALAGKRDEEVQHFFVWWRDELAGKHPHADEDKDRIVLNEGETHEAKELPQLNEGLFMRSQYTRLAAVEALNKLADGSSVPYLIIALRDPNGDVAYGAHHVLARLVPALGPYLPRSTFDTSRDQLAEAGVKWWVKHLQDAEQARLPEFMRTANKTPAK